MVRFARLVAVIMLFVFLPLDVLLAQSKTRVEMASLRPGNGLVWQRLVHEPIGEPKRIQIPRRWRSAGGRLTD
jgi:hypothetical protein